MIKRADVIKKYAALRRTMLESYQSAPETYSEAAAAMDKLLDICQKRTDAELVKQAIYYQDIIIDCERQMPLPSEPDGRTAGIYKVHRYTIGIQRSTRQSANFVRK